ncbi:MAG TPA: M56 family metallopeptidase [Verrucomicrobiae bacterium]|nr:M56 family metallopeptidase [Verrucomicrobiae bacterium]
MQTVADALNGFFTWLWRASWEASVMVLLVWLLQVLLRRQLTPRWRHGLWALVVLRLALPCSVRSPISLFSWLESESPAAVTTASADTGPLGAKRSDLTASVIPKVGLMAKVSAGRVLRWAWLAGALTLPLCLLIGNYRLGRKVRAQRLVTDGAVLSLLEDCKKEMGVRTPLVVVETDLVASPSLFGFIRPRLLMPSGLARSFSLEELRYVFLHELGHVKRRDIPMNWLMTLTLMLHWFNPLAWYVCSRMRVERELACDELALEQAREAENRPYGRTIIKLLEGFNRPAVIPGLVGILENKTQMKRRISMIAKFKRTNQWSVAAGVAVAGLALVTLTDPPAGNGADEPSPSNPSGPPRILSSTPRTGDTEVDPGLQQVTVTFDRDMDTSGYSWTGGGPEFPGREDQRPQWRDKRTCVLPVKVEAAHYYRIGINAPSFRNFRSAAGVAVIPTAIQFTTKGASLELKRKATRPQIVALTPRNGAQDVDSSLTELRVTFNVPMGDGFSWTGGGPEYPNIPAGKKPYWTEDHLTCVLPVQLQPGSDYRLGLNSPSFRGFQSATGVPLEPVSYRFKTK